VRLAHPQLVRPPLRERRGHLTSIGHNTNHQTCGLVQRRIMEEQRRQRRSIRHAKRGASDTRRFRSSICSCSVLRGVTRGVGRKDLDRYPSDTNQLKGAQAQQTASARATSERLSEGMHKNKHIIRKQRCKRSPPGAPLFLTNTAHAGPVGLPQPPLPSLCRKCRLQPRRQQRRAAASPPAPSLGAVLPPCNTPPSPRRRDRADGNRKQRRAARKATRGLSTDRCLLVSDSTWHSGWLTRLRAREGGAADPKHQDPTGDMRR